MMELEIGSCGNESLRTKNNSDLSYVFRHA